MKDETAEKISASDLFLVIATPHYFKDTRALRETDIARSLGKKFLILLSNDAEMPTGFLDGIDYKIEKFDPNEPKSLKTAFEKLTESFKRSKDEDSL